MTTRREFIKLLGLTLASLVASGVVPACSTLSDAQHPAWNTIRQCWLSLGQGKSQEDVDRQKADYQAALNRLVDADKIEPDVSAQLWLAYEEAAYYYSLPPEPTCYTPTAVRIPTATPLNCYVATPTPLPTATPLPATCYESPELNGVRSDLVWRIAMLEEMVKKGDIKSETANEARTALERELSFFEAVAALQSLEVKEHIKSEDQLVVLMQDGNLKISPEAAKAADLLVDLLLGKN